MFSIVNVWSKCSHCDYVWRSSVLRTFFDYAMGTAGLRRPKRNLEAYVACAATMAPAVSDGEIDIEVETEVDAWVMENTARHEEQISELFKRIDGPAALRTDATLPQSGDATVDAFCASLAHDPSRSIRPAGRKRQTPFEPSKKTGSDPVPPVPDQDLSLTESADRMVKNIETVCETFERLEQQFAGLERSFSQMIA